MKKPKTLLEKAKAITLQRGKPITEEQIALALAWARREVTYGQVQQAYIGERGGMTAYVLLARALREHINRIEKDNT